MSAPRPHTAPGVLLLALPMLAMALLSGCASRPAANGQTDAEEPVPATGRVLARGDRLLIYESHQDEPLSEVARRFLGSPDLGWTISEANKGATQAEAGKPLIVPLQPVNVTGVRPDRYQTVPILCYHRFAPGDGGRGPGRRMTVSVSDFAAQMGYLARHGYQVVRLADLEGWLEGRKALPARAVVITADDGYVSFYKHAYPVLRRHGFPATLFVYSDFIGAGDAVDWSEMKAMLDAGLIDVQAHSRTHRNLLDRANGESDEAYQQVLENETRWPRELLARRLGRPQRHFAYPYGDANQAVLDTLRRQGVTLAVTVTPGGNPFFAHPLMLRRTMVYGDMSLDDFKARLQTSRAK